MKVTWEDEELEAIRIEVLAIDERVSLKSFGPTRMEFEMNGKVQAVEPKDTVWFGGDPKQLADMLAAAWGVSNG